MPTEIIRAPLSRMRADIRGTPPDDFPDNITLLSWMDDERLSEYLSGRMITAKLGLPGSEFVTDESAIAQNLKELRERTRLSPELDVMYAEKFGRTIPQDVIDFLKSDHL